MLYTAQDGFKSLAAEKGCHMRFRVLNGKSPVCSPSIRFRGDTCR